MIKCGGGGAEVLSKVVVTNGEQSLLMGELVCGATLYHGVETVTCGITTICNRRSDANKILNNEKLPIRPNFGQRCGKINTVFWLAAVFRGDHRQAQVAARTGLSGMSVQLRGETF